MCGWERGKRAAAGEVLLEKMKRGVRGNRRVSAIEIDEEVCARRG